MAAIKGAEVVDCPESFFNNSCKYINRFLKDWQNRKKLDVKQFVESYETLAKAQESDVLRAFVGAQSPFTPTREFSSIGI